MSAQPVAVRADVWPHHRPVVVADTRKVNAENNREQWLQIRRQGIGSSDAAAVLGLDPWTSPFALYVDKVGDIPIDADADNEAMWWGRKLEGVVAERFRIDTGLRVQRRNAVLAHPSYPWMLANLDREVFDPEKSTPWANLGPAVCEIKTTGQWKAEEWEDGNVPDRAAIQIQWQLAVTGYRHAYAAVLIGGQDFRWVHVDRDESIVANLIEAGVRFWRRVVDREPPPVDAHPSTSQALQALFPESVVETVDLPSDAADLIASYNAAKEAEKLAKEQKDAAANALKALIGDAKVGLLDGEKAATWSRFDRRDVDAKRLKAERPDIYDEYAPAKPSGRLTVS